jgi:NADH-quinone oxidoreductase subunit K
MINEISIFQFLHISVTVFLLGIWCAFVLRRNVITIIIAVELLLLSINLNFIIFSVYLNDILGQVFALLVLTVAAAESAIGLAILVVYYRITGLISVDYVTMLKG